MIPMNVTFFDVSLVFPPPKAHSNNDSTMIKSYFVESDNEESLSAPAPEAMLVNDVTYRLESVKYQIISTNMVRLKRTITVADKGEVPKNLKHFLPDGSVVYLEASDKIAWKEMSRPPKLVVREYADGEEIPKMQHLTYSVSGKPIACIATLTDTKPIQKRETFSAIGEFHGQKGINKYRFNDKFVCLTDGQPRWPGFHGDIKEFLGFETEMILTSWEWLGARVFHDGFRFSQKAVFKGTRTVRYIKATYQETKATRTQYSVEVEYKGINPNEKVKAVATATYKKRT